MRRIIGLVLMGLAAFLITAALLAATYVPGQLKKTPLDVDSMTRLSGTARTLPSGDGGQVRALSHTVANGQFSDSDVVVFDSFTCLVRGDSDVQDCSDDTGAESPLVTASTDTFATDRRTAMAVQDPQYVPAESQHEGLVNKFPFDVKQETYPFWDGVVDRTVDAVFQGEESIDGLRVYRFLTTVENEAAEIAAGIDGTYSSLKTMWIDPVTGSIIKQQENQSRLTSSGTPVLEMILGFTDETVAANVESAKSSGSQLSMLSTAPWVLGLIGLLALAAGGFLVAGARPREEEVTSTYDDTAYADEPVVEQAHYEDRTEQFFDEAERRPEEDVETRRSRRELNE